MYIVKTAEAAVVLIWAHFCAHSNTGTCAYMRTCKFSLYKQLNGAVVATPQPGTVTVNDASPFDAVSQTDCPAFNPLLNWACHTKASCTPSCQCKHLFTLMPLSLIHEWRKDTFVLSHYLDNMSPWKQAGLEKVSSSVKVYIGERRKPSSSYVY